MSNPTYHVNVIKLKWEIMWIGGLPTKAVTSPTWGPPPPCKQALTGYHFNNYGFEKLSEKQLGEVTIQIKPF